MKDKVYICYMSIDYEGVLDYSIKLFRNEKDALDFGMSENSKYGSLESSYTIKQIEIN